MKKIIALALVAIMTVALCIGVSANTSLDRLTINNNTLPTMPDDETNLRNAEEITIAKGDKLFILGWAYGDESNLKEVVYTIDGVEHACADNYRDRVDVAQAFGIDASLGVHAGIGQDDNWSALTPSMTAPTLSALWRSTTTAPKSLSEPWASTL